MLLRDIVDLDATYGSNTFDADAAQSAEAAAKRPAGARRRPGAEGDGEREPPAEGQRLTAEDPRATARKARSRSPRWKRS